MDIAQIKIKKTKSSTPINFPKFPPYAVVGDYLSSVEQSRLPKKLPEWDVARGTPATELIIARRDFALAEKRLKEKRKEAIVSRATTDAQWKDLADKEDALGRNFKKFNKFVKENQDKRTRAEKKIEDDLAMQKKRDQDIKEIETKLNEIKAIKTQMEQYVREYRIYEEYMQKVVADVPEFRTLTDILNRYEALTEAKETLSDKQESDLLQLEQARTKLIKLTEEKTLDIMGLQNKLGDLQSRFELAKSKAMYWEMIVSKIKITSIQKTLELHQVKHSCWNIYSQMCARKQIPADIDRENMEAQLVFIKNTLTELKRVLKKAKAHAVKMQTAKTNKATKAGSKKSKTIRKSSHTSTHK